jgi:hypothetical protein
MTTDTVFEKFVAQVSADGLTQAKLAEYKDTLDVARGQSQEADTKAEESRTILSGLYGRLKVLEGAATDAAATERGAIDSVIHGQKDAQSIAPSLLLARNTTKTAELAVRKLASYLIPLMELDYRETAAKARTWAAVILMTTARIAVFEHLTAQNATADGDTSLEAIVNLAVLVGLQADHEEELVKNAKNAFATARESLRKVGVSF